MWPAIHDGSTTEENLCKKPRTSCRACHISGFNKRGPTSNFPGAKRSPLEEKGALLPSKGDKPRATVLRTQNLRTNCAIRSHESSDSTDFIRVGRTHTLSQSPIKGARQTEHPSGVSLQTFLPTHSSF